MAHQDSLEMSENPYKCRLSLVSPKGKGDVLERILMKLTDWVDPSRQIIAVKEKPEGVSYRKGPGTKSAKKRGKLVTPALSVMLFMRETGAMCVKDAERVLKKSPWKFHHKVELQSKKSPNTPLAKQEFYKLSDDLPLFAACPVLAENEHLRINLYVHNFPAMVEFYRLVTETESETNKPEFCIFQIYEQPGLDIQLSLKRSQYIYPAPVDAAFVSFNVKSVDMIKLGTGCVLEHVNANVFTTRDPDGNLVVLYETGTMDDQQSEVECSLAHSCCNHRKACLATKRHGALESVVSLDDLKSLKSTAESHDSGRYSDNDGFVAADNAVSHGETNTLQSSRKAYREVTEVSEASEGYSSSANLSVRSLNSRMDSLKISGNGRAPTKSDRKGAINSDCDDVKTTDSGNLVLEDNVTPVYI